MNIYDFMLRQKVRIGCIVFTALVFSTGFLISTPFHKWMTRNQITSVMGEIQLTPPVIVYTQSDAVLMFHNLNIAYFDGKLPAIPIAFDDSDENSGAYYAPVSPRISLQSYLKEEPYADTLQDVLLHEMAHEFVDVNFPHSPEMMSAGHGIHWKAEMRHLAAIGAFDDKLWTKLEKP